MKRLYLRIAEADFHDLALLHKRLLARPDLPPVQLVDIARALTLLLERETAVPSHLEEIAEAINATRLLSGSRLYSHRWYPAVGEYRSRFHAAVEVVRASGLVVGPDPSELMRAGIALYVKAAMADQAHEDAIAACVSEVLAG